MSIFLLRQPPFKSPQQHETDQFSSLNITSPIGTVMFSAVHTLFQQSTLGSISQAEHTLQVLKAAKWPNEGRHWQHKASHEMERKIQIRIYLSHFSRG